MSVERAIEQMISEAIEGSYWQDILSGMFADADEFTHTENMVEELRSDFDEIKKEIDFTLYTQAVESVGKLRLEVAKLSDELDKLKTRKTLIDYLKFWSK